MRNREGWEVKEIDDCFVLIRNGFNIKQNPNSGGVPITRIETLANGAFNRDRMGYADIYDTTKYSSYLLEDGDVLMSHINSLNYLGRAVLYKKKKNELIVHGMNLLNLRVDKEIVHSSFASYFFSSWNFKAQIQRIAKKSVNQASFSIRDLKRVSITIPPLPTQHQIVSELDTLNSIIDKKKEQLNELDNLAQATFYDMFGDPVENEKGWEVNKLGELSKVMTGATPSRRKEEEYYNGSIYWVKTTEVHNVQITSTEEKITELALKETNCKIFPVNTILLAMYGQGKTRGSVGLLQVEAATNQACAAILPNELADQVFLYELLKHSYNHLRSLSRGGNQENLNLSIVRGVDIILPPLSLQTQFAEKIKHIEKQKALIQRSIDDVQQLFDYTMDKYFN